ncbi:hypothetical protein FSP39_007259 [Pinctada imbricata]|uniref:VLIG-type G domain-containing protein n=1 Tax=Pinctada imbricata TaxID=66713 RepID=A0AA88XFE4_PINIB|nr:hypothetical protein FSP39_007259 [Pinctada imbricata]
MMTKVEICQSLETVFQKLDIIKDEDCHDCKNGQILADSIFRQISEGSNSFRSRKEVLMLQGKDYWVKWSDMLKDHNRKGATNCNLKECEVQDMDSIRLEQVSLCSKSTLMALLVDILFTYAENKRVLLFSLSWLKDYFERMSKKTLPSLETEFRKALAKYDETRSNDEKTKLQETKLKLNDAFFSLDHVFLELSQIYEAFLSQIDKKGNYIKEKSMIVLTSLPKIISDLLLWRQSLQVMDGEASNVPLRWIKSVFSGIRLKHDHVKLNTVSVLGIQSSGKSTLLNSMFGLQFNVSAGRCTTGVFAQLLHVRDRDSQAANYVIVFDTEGLRAPERLLEYDPNHDNEIATFVIGLGDIVLMNIKGETISDMKDVLEIVIHGLLRLKNANRNLRLDQSCIFVHQNVSAKDAKTKLLQGHQETLATLDEIAIRVAEDEGIQGIKAFKNVIEFDPVKSIMYVPDLWHGSPPMAPTSTKYSSNVMEVLNLVASKMVQRKNALTVLDTFNRLNDLWNGILKENFVFSFRNSLEIKAYNEFDIAFKTFGLEMEILNQRWIDSNVKKQLDKSECRDDLAKHKIKLREDFLKHLDEISKDIKIKLTNFARCSDLKELMSHWIDYFKKRVDALKHDLKADFNKRVEEHANICIVRFSEKSIFKQKRQEIHDKAMSLARSSQEKDMTEEDQKIQFDDMYEKWIQEVELENPSLADLPEERISAEVYGDILACLRNTYEKKMGTLQGGLQNTPMKTKDQFSKLQENKTFVEDIIKSRNWIPSSLFDAMKKHILKALAWIDDKIKDTMNTQQTVGKTEFRTVLDYSRESLSSFNEGRFFIKMNIKVEVDIIVLISRKCYHTFVNHKLNIKRENSLRSRLATFKVDTFMTFKDIVSKEHEDFIAAHAVSCTLKRHVWNDILTKLPEHLKKWIISVHSLQKFLLVKDILKQLTSQSNFQSFMAFIENPQRYALDYITSSTVKGFFQTVMKDSKSSPFEEWTNTIIDENLSLFNKTIQMLCEEWNSKNRSPTSWISEYTKVLRESVSYMSDDLVSDLEKNTIKDINQFKVYLVDQLESKRNELIREVVTMKYLDIKWVGQSPYVMALERIWGCKEKCPWCSEPCCRETIHGDEVQHRCIQHRPKGICGNWWIQSKQLCIENCNFAVGSTTLRQCGQWCKTCTTETCSEWHPYAEYDKYIPEWDIRPQKDTEGSKFWNWFMCKYSVQLAEYHEYKEADIPSSWKNISTSDALKSLNDLYT